MVHFKYGLTVRAEWQRRGQIESVVDYPVEPRRWLRVLRRATKLELLAEELLTDLLARLPVGGGGGGGSGGQQPLDRRTFIWER